MTPWLRPGLLLQAVLWPHVSPEMFLYFALIWVRACGGCDSALRQRKEIRLDLDSPPVFLLTEAPVRPQSSRFEHLLSNGTSDGGKRSRHRRHSLVTAVFVL